MYLLDTNVISEMRLVVKDKGNSGVRAWAAEQDERLLYTNIVVLMEIECGILNVKRRDQQQALALHNWFIDTVKVAFQGRVLTLDETTANICATLHIPDRAPDNDAWIAASAIQHGLTLVTRNSRDFQHANLRVLNPFVAID